MVWAIAKLPYDDQPLLAAISAPSLPLVPDFDLQHLSNTAWAFAACLVEDVPLMNALACFAIPRISLAKPQDVANIAWAFAKLGFLHRPLLYAISAVSESKQLWMSAECSHQNVANIAWSFAALGVVDVPLMASISISALRTMGDWGSQSLANTVWAFASLELLNAPLLDAMSGQVVEKIAELSPQELMNTAWSFATLGVFDQPLLDAIAEEALQKLEELLPQDLAGLAWALSACSVCHGQFLKGISEAAMKHIGNFKPQDLANTAWSFANLGVGDEPLFTAISSAAVASIAAFQPQDLGNTVWAFAKLEIVPGELFMKAIASASLAKLSELQSQNLAMTAWAYATLGVADQPLLAAISSTAVGRLHEFALHDLANLLWAYPTLELQVDSALFSGAREMLLQLLPTELGAVLARVAGVEVTSQVATEISEFTSSLLELAWAFAFSGQETEDLSAALRAGLAAIARKLDEGCSAATLLRGQAVGSPTSKAQAREEPLLVLDLPDIAVVLKPPSWEVDARPPGEPSSGEEAGARKISSFLQSCFSQETCPLVHSRDQQYGIIHRLDVPSSGLILVGKTFCGYYTLRWQQDTYELGRHYLVLCHGRLDWSSQVINAKIKTTKTFPAMSVVSDAGKPAWTRVTPLCIVHRGSEEFTLVVIMIRTGRTHQIRVHMAHIGHPSVTDGKYTDPAVYSADLKWCPRNFLHRFRLTFQDTATASHEALAPLPGDLRAVLAELRPAEARSEETCQKLLNGWVPSAHLV